MVGVSYGVLIVMAVLFVLLLLALVSVGVWNIATGMNNAALRREVDRLQGGSDRYHELVEQYGAPPQSQYDFDTDMVP